MLNDPHAKIMTLDEAVKWRETLEKSGKTLAVTNGCFDILHRGHAEYLLAARKTAGALLVLLNDDESIKALKGPARPVNGQNDRAYLLACLEFVDAVVIFHSQRCTEELAAIMPDDYVKGGDYTLEKLNAEERRALLECGANFHFIPFVPGYSTTSVIEACKN